MQPLHWPALLVLALLGIALTSAAISDVRFRIIGNRLNLAIALLALPWWWANGLSGSMLLGQVALGLAVFAIFAGLFAIGLMGGGDVKLLAALALWFPLTPFLHLLVWMALGGGVLTIAMMVLHRIRRAPEPLEIPYGLAIVGATFLVLANDILTTSAA